MGSHFTEVWGFPISGIKTGNYVISFILSCFQTSSPDNNIEGSLFKKAMKKLGFGNYKYSKSVRYLYYRMEQ